MRSHLRTLLLACIPSLALALGAVSSWPLVRQWQGDISIYARYAQRLIQGEVPFRDFVVEYPPLALVAFVGPQLVEIGEIFGLPSYTFFLLLENMLFCAVTTYAVLQTSQILKLSVGYVVVVMATLIFVLSPVLSWRFDMFPTMFAALALMTVVRQQTLGAGWWFGAGVAAKLYPAVLGPIVALQLMVARRWNALMRMSIGGALALAVTVLPAYVLAGNKLWVFLTYHQQRGLQIESVAGGIVALGTKLGWTRAEIIFNFGALHFVSPWADALLPLLTPLLLMLYAVLLFAAYQCFRAQPDNIAALVALSSAALLLFIVTNKVFSPQYLVWLLPYMPLMPRRQSALFGAICVATVVIFPFQYNAMLALELWTVALLNARNAATIVLLVWIVYSTWRGARNAVQ